MALRLLRLFLVWCGALEWLENQYSGKTICQFLYLRFCWLLGSKSSITRAKTANLLLFGEELSTCKEKKVQWSETCNRSLIEINKLSRVTDRINKTSERNKFVHLFRRM